MLSFEFLVLNGAPLAMLSYSIMNLVFFVLNF